MGGMGNQMFQYAAARRLALRHQTDLVLDLGWFAYEGRHFETPRSFALDRFPLAAARSVLRERTVAAWERGRGRRPFGARPLAVIRQRDRDAALDTRVLEAGDDVMLIGYWQSERYFSDVADTIRSDFAFDSVPGPRYTSWDREIRRSRAVAVHVRRGDYASNPRASAVHGVLPGTYYGAAAQLMLELEPDASFFVFSDEPGWVVENFRPGSLLRSSTEGIRTKIFA